MPYKGKRAIKVSTFESLKALIRTWVEEGERRDARFDESMERINENLAKSKRSQEAIDEWLNRQPHQ